MHETTLRKGDISHLSKKMTRYFIRHRIYKPNGLGERGLSISFILCTSFKDSITKRKKQETKDFSSFKKHA
jgi:hypothetical protein